MQSREIRQRFVEFFAERGHLHVSSSPLIPRNDPTVLLTTAGMQQMTPYFLGLEQPPANRMTSVQKCFRTVDIDDVGDERHATFFEMLGNFSVGNYFKREAIRYAWDLLTVSYGIPAERLQVTIHPDDDEARQLWMDEVGLAPERIHEDPTNIWGPVGETGPCGPDSELHVDRGAQYGCGEPDCGPNCPRCDRWMELWNLVFMGQFKEADGSFRELERKNIDTGMGLERISMILQNAPTMYETDLHQPMILRAAEIAGVTYGADPTIDRSLRVISDHVRGATFLIMDGVLPGNEGRGYVLRRILRRAVRHARAVGIERPFLVTIVDVVIDRFGGYHPDMITRAGTIRRIVENEEQSFSRTLATGMARFAELVDALRAAGGSTISGEDAFRLYDTYGFPYELTTELAADVGVAVDAEGFAVALEQSRARSRQHVANFADTARDRNQLYARLQPVEFLGYGSTSAEAAVAEIVSADALVEQLDAGQPGELVLDRTPFYGESGGQVGDTGVITTETGVFQVHDTQRPTPTVIVHRGEVSEGFIQRGQVALAAIDAERRDAIRRNHTATHVLHRALRMILGEDTYQAGSLVAPDRLRFDFTSAAPLGPDGIQRATEIANTVLLRDDDVTTDVMSYDDAVARGAMALFGEKYGDLVRMVSIGEFSRELCGGTHVRHAAEIGPIVILSESSIGSGVRRIEALTGRAALEYLQRLQLIATDAARTLHIPVEELAEGLRSLQSSVRDLDRTIDQLRLSLATSDVESIVDTAVEVSGVTVLATRVVAGDRDTMLQIGDRLRDKLRSGVIVLGSEIDDKPALVAMVTRDLTARGVSAGKLIQELAPIIGGRGGGRPELANGGGTDATRLDDALGAVESAVSRQLGG